MRQLIPFLDRSVEQWTMEARVLRWLTFLWLFLGLTILFSASFITADLDFGKGWKLFAQQLLWTGLGLMIFHGVVHLPVKRMVQFSGIGMIAIIGLLLATYVPGLTVCINDSCRWLQVGGGFLLQPSELLKPFLLLQASRLFANWQQTPWQERLTWLGLFAFTLVTILLQPSLSMTALYGSTLWLIAMAAGLPWVQLGGVALSGIVVAVLSVTVKDYQRRRLMTFLDPWKDAAGDGFQLVQSLLAIGSGGIFGRGFGLSEQKSFLPIQDTDFIFAVFAEEFGLVGCTFFLILLGVFATLGLRVAMRSQTMTVRLVATGATILLVGQSFLNIGVATGALPTTGLPFPMLSYGGNAMLASLTVAGLLVRSAREMTVSEVATLDRVRQLREKRRFSGRR
ncbi:MAG: FtsW/RodA/SpoVE family cell cycle protein [Cyanobacteria bacterium KgW148]|nr:FtsW/RodA/SpoVE family cell cycle protein [Cyanobacteria bacterium KgW148]